MSKCITYGANCRFAAKPLLRLNNCANGDEADVSFVQTRKMQSLYCLAIGYASLNQIDSVVFSIGRAENIVLSLKSPGNLKKKYIYNFYFSKVNAFMLSYYEPKFIEKILLGKVFFFPNFCQNQIDAK